MESFAILSGYITNEPEVKVAGNGKTVINFSVSVYAKFKKDGDKKHVSFMNCEYWPIDKIDGNVQREIAKLEKGTLISFKAEPIQDRWEQDGKKNSKIKFNVEGFIDVIKHHSKKSETEPAEEPTQFIEDDDCPF